MPELFKLRAELQGHSKDVRCLTEASSPERSIVSGSRDCSVKIWSENQDHEYRERHSLKGHKNFVYAVACMSPNDQYPHGMLFSASMDKTIRAYAGDPPEFQYELTGHTETVSSLAVDNRRHLVISSSFDKTIRIWSHKTCLHTLAGHEQVVWSVIVVPEDSDNVESAEYKSDLPLILSCAADKLIKLWKDGKCVKTFSGHTDVVRSLSAFSPFEFFSCSNDSTVKRWNVLTGECVATFSGHENYVYSVSVHPSFDFVVSGGEDRSLRIWNVDGDGGHSTLRQTIHLPAQSIWSVLTLSSGDVACATSDGVLRVFTMNDEYAANKEASEVFDQQVAAFANLHSASDELGGIKISELPGKEALHQIGTKDGQQKLIRVGKNVEVYAWSEQKYTWEKIGDVLGAKGPTEGKKAYMGKEYDYVFDVDVEEGKPTLKLPYNIDEDPWHAAQRFIHDNMLPQVYLDEVVQFIQKSAPDAGTGAQPMDQGFADPFTGGGRYVPGSASSTSVGGAVDPFTGAGRYVPGSGPQTNGGNSGGDPLTASGRYVPHGNDGWDKSKIDPIRPRGEHMPLADFILFTSTAKAMLSKLRESNVQLNSADLQVDDEQFVDLERLIATQKLQSKDSLKTLHKLLKWPVSHLVPALDVFRLSLVTDFVADHFFQHQSEALELIDRFCRFAADKDSPFQFRILSCRVFANSFAFSSGRKCLATCPVELASVLLEHCVCSDKPAVQIAAAATLANFSLMFLRDDQHADKKMAFAKRLFDGLKEVDAVGFSLLDKQSLLYLLQSLVTVLWGDRVVIDAAKGCGVPGRVVKIKDAYDEENGKNIARSIERMFN